MEKQELDLSALLLNFKSKYKNIKIIKVRFEGSGDSFDDFYDDDIIYYDPSNATEDEEDRDHDLSNIYWKIIEKTSADFNNDGCEGEIMIDFTKNTYQCVVNYIENVRKIYDIEEVSENFFETKTLEFNI